MAGVEVTLVVTPVHNGHVRGGELLAFHNGKLGEPGIGDQLADVVHCFEDSRLICGIYQVVENGACDDRKVIFLKFGCNNFSIDGHVAVRSELDGCVAGLVSFGKDLGPVRKIGILGIVYAPARRSTANLHRHLYYLLRINCVLLSLINQLKSTQTLLLFADSTHFSSHLTPCAPASTLGYQKSPYSLVSAPLIATANLL